LESRAKDLGKNHGSRGCGETPVPNESDVAMRSRVDLKTRLLKRVDKSGPIPESRPELGPCWLWLGSLDEDGYGHICRGGRCGSKTTAHRASFEAHVGIVPNGLQLDHLCRVRRCVNPDHLEPVTCAVNIARGKTGESNRLKSHCRNGHPYDQKNTYFYNGSRYCRACCATRRRVRDASRKLLNVEAAK
jgi:hypothetical protein